MVVKYSTSAIPNTIKTNNIVFGLDNADYGPTSTSGFWNGIDPPSSGYTIYTLTESRQEPSIVVAHNDAEAIYFAKSFGGTNINTINDAINYFLSGSSYTTIANITYPNIVTNGLMLHVDPAFLPSYPGNGTHVKDLNHTTGWNFGGSTVSFDNTTQSFNFSVDGNAKYLLSDTSFELISATSGITYDFWCYLVDNVDASLPSLFYDTGQGANPFVWIYENAGSFAIQFAYGTAYTAVATHPTVFDTWRNLVISIQYGPSTYLTSYVNGSISNLDHYIPGVTGSFPNINNQKYIGCYGASGGHNWTGKMGAVKIYDRILSQTEITKNYDALKFRYFLGDIITNGMVLCLDAKTTESYPGTGSIWYDLSENHNNSDVYAQWNSLGYFNLSGGTYNKVATTPASLQGDQNFTVFGAFKRNASYSSGSCWGIGGEVTSQGFNTWNSSYTNEITMDLWGDTTYSCGQTFPLEQWVLVHWIKTAGTYTTASLTIYVNTDSYTGGQLTVIRDGIKTPDINSNGIVIGRAGGTTNDYYAKVDVGCLVIYNRVLSSTEVQHNFNALKGRYGL